MDELTFDEAVEILRDKVFMQEDDYEFRHALNTVIVMWDQERVDQLNHAVLSSKYYKIEPDTLYILMQPTVPKYLMIKKAGEYDTS